MTKKTIELDPLEQAINKFADQYTSGKLSDMEIQAQLNYIGVIAQVKEGVKEKLAAYRAEAENMSPEQLGTEPHLSERLSRHMEAIGDTRPSGNVDAHAIVPGSHKYGAQLRALMAALRIRIDDPDNGMWMPSRTADTPHPAFPACPPHSRIHRWYYYEWIRGRLATVKQAEVFRVHLNVIKKQLHEGKQPDYVMLPKGAKGT